MTRAVAEIVDKLEVGEDVEVRRRFDAGWAKGFQIAEHTDGGYRIKRLSDGALLPIEFKDDEVRKERHRSMWWY